MKASNSIPALMLVRLAWAMSFQLRPVRGLDRLLRQNLFRLLQPRSSPVRHIKQGVELFGHLMHGTVAKAAIANTPESLENAGNERRCWFVLGHYIENGKELFEVADLVLIGFTGKPRVKVAPKRVATVGNNNVGAVMEITDSITEVVNSGEFVGDGCEQPHPSLIAPAMMPTVKVKQVGQRLPVDVAEDQKGYDFTPVPLPNTHMVIRRHGGDGVEALEGGGNMTERFDVIRSPVEFQSADGPAVPLGGKVACAFPASAQAT